MPTLFRWRKGRQNTGYETLALVHSVYLMLDCYLLRYSEGTSIPPHIDEVQDGKMYRLNIELWRANKGGVPLDRPRAI